MAKKIPAVGLAILLSASGTSAKNPSVVPPSCVTYTSAAIYRAYGYDHVVHLSNRCEGDAVCDVATDVNPDPQHVAVPGNGSVDVLTFRGSPARTFTPRVSCKAAG